MIQPHEMKLNLPMKLSNEVVSTTRKDIQRLKKFLQMSEISKKTNL